MDFLKKHYEKVLLGAVLLGLAGAVGFLFFKIASEKEELERKETELTKPRVTPLPELDLGAYQAVLQRLGASALLDLSVPHKLFNPIEEEVSCKKVSADGMLLDIAHLIDTKSIEKYQNRYSTAAKQFKDCQLFVTGPWPPYHFLPGKVRTVAGDS